MALNLPDALMCERRWVVARLESVNGRLTKVPYCAFDPTRKASSTDAATWADYETAVRAVRESARLELGFVLGGGFVGVDLDHCRNAETGEIEPWAHEIVVMLDSYTEVSISGSGVHVICRGQLPPGSRRTGQIEMYDSARYFVMTGDVIRDSNIEERSDELSALHRSLFGAPSVNDGINFDPNDTRGKEHISDGDVLRPVTNIADDDLLARIRESAQGDKFSRLWAGDTSLHGGDHSVADLALCTILAFWTQRDAERIDRLFRRSKLNRAKWTRRADYRARTIGRAIVATANAYQPPFDEIRVEDF